MDLAAQIKMTLGFSGSRHWWVFKIMKQVSHLVLFPSIPLIVIRNMNNNSDPYNLIPVVPGQAGAEVSKKKTYKSKKEFAYRMRARRPTSAMPKPFLCCERASAVPWW